MPASARFPIVTGATVYDGDATFRVWAPNAAKLVVSVQPADAAAAVSPPFAAAAPPGVDNLFCQGNVGVGPYTALILSQDA